MRAVIRRVLTLSVLGAIALASFAVRTADASSCYLGPELLSSAAPKLGCPIVVSRNAYQGYGEPVVRAIRDTDNLDVTGTVTTERREITTPYYQLDCQGSVEYENDVLEPYDIFTIELSEKAQVGDMIYTDGLAIAPLQPAGECEPLVEPMPICTIMALDCHFHDNDDPPHDHDASVGCMSAGGGATNAGSMVLVLGLAFVARRARRRRA